MKMRPFHLFKLAAAAMLALPALAFAVPASSPYYTDTVNSYVQDQVSEDMSQLNGFLCFISAMAPNLLVNEGDYIALVDENTCFNDSSSSGSSTGGGQSNNTGTQYLSVQANSSRASNASPMQTKIWLDIASQIGTLNVPMYASASQAPSTKLPYGIFRMDYCQKLSTATSCDENIGYIDATKTGLAFYTSRQSGTYFNEFALQLSANSTNNSGSGIVIKTNNYNNIVTTSAIVFAHSPDYFYRDDGTTPQCFNRSTNYAAESAWRYGLYHADTGERFMHQSGFPVEYTYTSANTSGTGTAGETYNGYISYYGLWMPVTLEPNATVNQITYDTGTPVKTPYTLLQTGGKLTKYTTNYKSLTDLHKLPIWYYPYAYVAGPTSTGCYYDATTSTQYSSDCVMNAYQNYEIYWDKDANKFYVSSAYNSTTYNMEKLPSPLPVDNTAIVAADLYQWGLSGWSELVGGNFNIKATDFAQLATTTSATRVITQTQDVVYPKDFAAINTAGGLQCITDCPTKVQIDIYNTNGANYYDTPFTSPSYTYTFDGTYYNYTVPSYSTLINRSYTLDPSTGNLLDGGTAVTQSTTNTVYSGRLVTGTDMASIQTAKTTLCGTGCTYSQSDVDLLDTLGASYSYYVWETSSNSWNQMAFLLDSQQNTVTFYPPLQVTFDVPGTSTYENLSGTSVTLQYGEFGSLWGIPYKCVDLRSNTDCVYTGTFTPYDYQRWAPQFSIPFNTSTGVVTAAVSQGEIGSAEYVAQGTQFLVKALDKEIRLAKVPIGICTVLGLTEPINVTRLPSAADWIDPSTAIGTKPVLNPMPAPRVIHGVKQY